MSFAGRNNLRRDCPFFYHKAHNRRCNVHQDLGLNEGVVGYATFTLRPFLEKQFKAQYLMRIDVYIFIYILCFD